MSIAANIGWVLLLRIIQAPQKQSETHDDPWRESRKQYLRLVRRDHALVVQLSPVEPDFVEHGVRHDVLEASAQVAQPVRGVRGQEASDQVPSRVREPAFFFFKLNLVRRQARINKQRTAAVATVSPSNLSRNAEEPWWRRFPIKVRQRQQMDSCLVPIPSRQQPVPFSPKPTSNLHEPENNTHYIHTRFLTREGRTRNARCGSPS